MLKKHDLVKIQDNILLLGESGVGKSTLANWIHDQSSRSRHPFIQLNISTLSDQLFESELFGHVKGSFTGAHQEKFGFCEQVGEGTLFLDEIGELSLSLQKKILTLVEEKLYYPVGSTRPKKFKGKLIFATHRDLKDEIKKGKFREDLFYRISTFPYKLKALREYKDKTNIINSIIDQSKKEFRKDELTVSCDALCWLNNYEFPGNFRELKQFIKYMVFTANREIRLEHLPCWVEAKQSKAGLTDDYYDALELFEKDFLVDKLKKYKGMINKTAQKINISKVTLISKIKKYDINIPHLKMESMNGF